MTQRECLRWVVTRLPQPQGGPTPGTRVWQCLSFNQQLILFDVGARRTLLMLLMTWLGPTILTFKALAVVYARLTLWIGKIGLKFYFWWARLKGSPIAVSEKSVHTHVWAKQYGVLDGGTPNTWWGWCCLILIKIIIYIFQYGRLTSRQKKEIDVGMLPGRPAGIAPFYCCRPTTQGFRNNVEHSH